MRTPSSRLSLAHVVIVAAVVAGSIQLIPHVGSAWAYAPKGSVSKTKSKAVPTGGKATPKAPVSVAGKPSFYVRKDSSLMLGNTGGIVAAACDDKDDIAFNASCYSVGDARIQSERMINWTSNQARAEVECRVFNDTTRSINVEAHIFCMPYDAEK